MRKLKILLAATLLMAGNAGAQSSALMIQSGGGDGGGDGGGSSPDISILQGEIKSSTAHTLEMSFSNGVQFVIDDSSNRIFIANSSATREFNLDAALLQWANNDQARATALRQKLRTTLNDPMREMSLTSDNFQMASSMLGSDTTCFSVDGDCNSDGSGIENFSASVSDFQASGWGTYSVTFLGFGPPDQQQEQDWFYWNRWREDNCEDAATSARAIGLLAAGTIAACGAVVACVAGALAIANEVDSWASASAACRAPYPGPGRW